MNTLWQFIENNHHVYFKLLKNDFKARYIGSYLGIVWGFIQPIITVLIYWFVFTVGLRSGERPDGTPYIIWMIAGLLPWFYFSDALGAITNTFLEYSYMVKKINFRIGLLPFVKVGSSMIIHLVFLTFTTIVLNFYGFWANWIYLQLIYYLLATTLLVIGIGLLTSSLAVYLRDTSQVIAIVIQIGFWAIPIVWGPEVLGGKWEIFFKANPIYFLVEGYRDTLLRNMWFWQEPLYDLYFWGIVVLIWIIGIRTFRRLKPYFADVL